MHHLVRLFPGIWRISGPLSGLLWLYQVRRLVKRIKPDILDAHYIGIPAYLGVVSGFRPLAYNAWGSDILIDIDESRLRKYITKYSLKKAALVTCTSPQLKDRLEELGIAPNRVKVAFLGVETNIFSPEYRDETLIGELGIANSPIVISTRNLKPVYNLEMLISAIPLVLKEIPEAIFIFAGHGEQRNYLEGLANDLGISDSIRFIGHITHNMLPKYLASSDVFISVSLSDGTPQSLLEAMACGLPAVVSDIPANRLWIEDGGNGFLVPIGDHQMLADKISYLLKNRDIREKFGTLNREKAKERAEYENQMSKIETMYKELLQ